MSLVKQSQNVSSFRSGVMTKMTDRFFGRFASSVTLVSFVFTTLFGSLAPAYAQTIVDPTAPITFQPSISNSANGTPTVNIVTPGSNGVSHNKFREYNVDTSGVILNNSSLGGQSVIGGAVSGNPNLVGGKNAKVIINEVNGVNASRLAGPTEVFGTKADVIVANPNGVGCVGCTFINAAGVTLSGSTPQVDPVSGAVTLANPTGDVTVSGSGISAPQGKMLEAVTLTGRTVSLDGAVKASGKVTLAAGQTSYDVNSGVLTASGFGTGVSAPGQAITSTSAGVVSAGSIGILSSDVGMGVQLKGSLQALAGNGTGKISIKSAGSIDLTSAESSGDIEFDANDDLELRRDFTAGGKITITARSAKFLASSGLTAGGDLSIVTRDDIAAAGQVKSGGDINVEADGASTLSGLIAARDALSISAGTITTDMLGLTGSEVSIMGKTVDLRDTWLTSDSETLVSGDDVFLREGTALSDTKTTIQANNTLTLGTVIDKKLYPSLALAFHNLHITETGVFADDNVALNVAGQLTNDGVVLGRDKSEITAGSFANTSSGVVQSAGPLELNITGSLQNLGSILSSSTLNIIAEDSLSNSGTIKAATDASVIATTAVENTSSGLIETGGDLDIKSSGKVANAGAFASSKTLTIQAQSYEGSSQLSSVIAENIALIVNGDVLNNGLLGAIDEVKITAGAGVTNAQTGIITAQEIDAAVQGDLTNLGKLVSSSTLNIVVGGVLSNKGLARAADEFSLNANVLSQQGQLASGNRLAVDVNALEATAESQTVARKLDLILAGDFSNNGILEATDELSLKISGNLVNQELGQINSRQVAVDIQGNLRNLGDILSNGAMNVVITGILSNSGTVAALEDLSLVVGKLENDGDDARIHTSGNLTVKAENLTNSFGEIVAAKNGTIHVDNLLANLSGRIETGGKLELKATSITNDAVAGSEGDVTRVEKLGVATVAYILNRPSSYNTVHQAYQDEFSGDIVTQKYGTIRSGEDLDIEADNLSNTEGRILSAANLSIKADSLRNDAKTYALNHYRNVWGSEQVWTQPFYAPTDIGWSTHQFKASAFRDPSLLSRAQSGDITIIISKGAAPVSKTYNGKEKYRKRLNEHAHFETFEYVDAAQLLNLEVLGIDPDNIPDTIVIGTRFTTLGEYYYTKQSKQLVGKTTVSLGSVINAKAVLDIDVATVSNVGTMSGDTVTIDAGTLQNGLPAIAAIDGAAVVNSSGNTRPINIVLDDVIVPPLKFTEEPVLPSIPVNRSDFGKLEELTGSTEAATLLAGVSVLGQQLSIFSDPQKEATAFADAMARAKGNSLVTTSQDPEDIRSELYNNALEFSKKTGASYGTSLTEAQRAALDKPLAWYETRIVDGQQVLVPVVYLPAKDDLLRGSRGPGLIEGNDLIVKVKDTLTNTGSLVAKDIASISAKEIVNERLADLEAKRRGDTEFGGTYGGVLGRNDSGLISAGSLFVQTDGSFTNSGGKLTSAGQMDLNIGGDFVNETLKVSRAVDFLDGCEGKGCGTQRTAWSVGEIAAGEDLTLVAGGQLLNIGGRIGAGEDALLAAAGDIRMETLQDSFLQKDVKARGRFSKSHIIEHVITTQEAEVQSLTGNLSILAGYSICDGGKLCASGNPQADAILNGAVISAYEDVTIAAAGDVSLGAVTKSVDNKLKQSGFAGLSWSKVKQNWNTVDTRTTRIVGENVTVKAGGDISGIGTRIAATNDLLILSDGTISFKAAQSDKYFTEKGFSIGLSFPGSAGIDAALRGASGKEILQGLASVNPFTETLARVSQSENGIAAALASAYVTVGGLNGLKSGPDALKRLIDPTGKFSVNGEVTAGSVASSISINISKWKTERHWSDSNSSQLTAGNDVIMKAGLDAILGDGTQLIAGGDANVFAQRDIVLAALEDYVSTRSKSFSLSIKPFALEAGFNVGNTKGNDLRYTNAAIEAAGNVNIQSGRDVTLTGGNIIGKSVIADIGRDLNITSLHDTSIYREKNFGASISFSPAGIGGSVNASKTTGDFANVYTQSGIIAGKDGFDIDVARKVDLTGGLIVSSASEDKNTLSASELTYRDLQNVSKSKTQGGGISFSPGGLPTPIVDRPTEENASGTARATVSPATLDLRTQQQELASLNRDVTRANEQVPIFDIEALKQRQRDAAIISQALNLAVGDIAMELGWDEGSVGKVFAHGVVGAVVGAISGGDIALGALSAVAQEIIGDIIRSELAKNPNLTDAQRATLGQWAAVAVGAAIGGAQGAATALDAEKHNYLTHEQLKKAQAANRRLRDCNNDNECSAEALAEAASEVAYYQKLSQKNTQDLIAVCSKGVSAECSQRMNDLQTFVLELVEYATDPNSDNGASPYVFSVGPTYHEQILARHLKQAIDGGKTPQAALESAFEEIHRTAGGLNAFLNTLGVVGMAACGSVSAGACVALTAGAIASANELYGNAQQVITGKEAKSALIQGLVASGMSEAEAEKYQSYVDTGVLVITVAVVGGEKIYRVASRSNLAGIGKLDGFEYNAKTGKTIGGGGGGGNNLSLQYHANGKPIDFYSADGTATHWRNPLTNKIEPIPADVVFHKDHIYPKSGITRLDGFYELDAQQRAKLFNDPRNIQPLDGSMNCSKSNCIMDGTKPWLTYKGQPIDANYRDWLRKAQADLRDMFQIQINEMISQKK